MAMCLMWGIIETNIAIIGLNTTAKNNFEEEEFKVVIEKNSYKNKLDRENVA